MYIYNELSLDSGDLEAVTMNNVVWRKSSDVSEGRNATIFRVKEESKQPGRYKQEAEFYFLVAWLGWSSMLKMFLRNAGTLPSQKIVLLQRPTVKRTTNS